MKVINLDEKFNNNEPLTITIGNFDGVHIGHQLLINKVLCYKDTLSALMTFDPNPKSIFDSNYESLFTLDEKLDTLQKYNLDYIFIQKFTKDFMSLSVNEFINNLKKLNVVRVVVGSDFRFGYKAMGTVNDLKLHFIVDEIEVIENNEKIVSSSLIKELVKEGNFKEANELLSYNYFITGHIVHGNKVGRTLGFPTANVEYGNALIPKNGVYITKIHINTISYYGIANVGNNPTVNYSSTRKLEVFILGFSEQIYNLDVKLEFIDRIRDELKFNSVEDLINRMNIDKEYTKEYIKNNNL